MIEIERKFLVSGDDWRAQGQPNYYCQGYLNSDANNTVRVRIAGERAMLTVKGPTKGMRRLEFEYEVPVADAKEMLELCSEPPVEKHRTRIPAGDLVWEVDEFLGSNAGLILAEVELESEDQSIELPQWIGDEVTGDPRYFNSRLAKCPFSTWHSASSS